MPGKTLLFIDEIQESPWLVNLLRFFREEKPRLHVLAADSLFEVKLKEKGFSLPVGRVEFSWLYPLDFFEYLEARGEKNLLEFLKTTQAKTVIRVYSGQLKMEKVKLKGKTANFISLPFYLFPRWQEASVG